MTRRLAEKEKERERQEAEQRLAAEAEMQAQAATPPAPAPVAEPVSLPSGVLTPLLKRHKDLDDELKRRLRELEEK